MGKTPVRYVTARALRERFNAGDFVGRATTGELTIVLRRDGHPSLVGSSEPFCTRSQILAYLNRNGERIAVAHQYLRTDGALGGSGRPDPKMLVEGGIAYRVLEPER